MCKRTLPVHATRTGCGADVLHAGRKACQTQADFYFFPARSRTRRLSVDENSRKGMGHPEGGALADYAINAGDSFCILGDSVKTGKNGAMELLNPQTPMVG